LFQVAMLSVSSSFEDGIAAFAILDCRTLRPFAISGEIFPWFMMIPLYERPPAFASRIARQMRSGVAGMSKCATPACRIASSTAFMSAGSEPLTPRSEEHTSELQSHSDLVCRLLLEKK